MTIIELFHNHMWYSGKTELTVYDRDTNQLKKYEFDADRFDYVNMNDDVWLSDDWVIGGIYDGVLHVYVWIL